VKLISKLLISSVLLSGIIVALPSQSAFATVKVKESVTSTAADKAALSACTAFSKAISLATSFSSRKKSDNAAIEKAKTAAAIAILKGYFAAFASSLGKAIRLDSSFKSWANAAASVESFNGNDTASLNAAMAAMSGNCVTLQKKLGK
jgi:hypothetical protein